MAFAASHNGGRSQTGLNFLQTGGEYAFLNVILTAQNWVFASTPNKDGFVDPALLDTNGYPVTIQTGGYYTVCFAPSSWVGQSMTLQWDGGGTVRVPGTLIAGSATSVDGSVNNSLTCTCVDQHLLPGAVAVSPTDHIRNMRLSLTGSETTLLNAGNVFSTTFKNKLIEGGFGVLRFLDWTESNRSNLTTWASRKPTTYFSYAATEFRPSLYLGVSGGTGNAYTINGNGTGVPASGAPTDKMIVQLRFNADATTSGGATLSLNGTPAKPILDWWGGALSSGNNSYPLSNYFSTPTFGTLVYDAQLQAWMLLGAQFAWGSWGLNGGVPPELCIRLAAEVGAHAYIVVPRYAADGATDFVPSLAQYFRDNAPAWMVPRIEGPNETFNTANGNFHNGPFAANKAAVNYGVADFTRTYGKWMSIIGQSVAAVYGFSQAQAKAQKKYQVLCGVNTAFGANSSLAQFFDEEMTSASWIASSEVAPAGLIKDAARNWITHLCVAHYMTPTDYGTQQETDLATAYAAATDPNYQMQLLDYYADGLGARVNPGGDTIHNLASTCGYFAVWKAWALGHGVTNMCGYEGGWSPDYDGNNTALRNAAKASTHIPLYFASLFRYFLGLSDSTFTCEFPSTFLIADYTYGGTTSYAWSLLKGDIESANTPQFDFIARFNKGKRAVDPRLRIHG